MTETRVPPSGPKDAELAFVAQSPGYEEGEKGRPLVGPAGQALRRMAAEVGLDLSACWLTNICDRVLLGSTAPKVRDLKEGAARIRAELAELPNLKGVVLLGAYASKLAFSAPISVCQGRSDRLFAGSRYKNDATWAEARDSQLAKYRDVGMQEEHVAEAIAAWDARESAPSLSSTGYPVIACWHPSYWLRLRDKFRKQTVEADIKTVLALAPRLSEPPTLPAITMPNEVVVTGLVGLDTETEDVEGLREKMGLKGSDGPDPRALRCIAVGLSTGECVTHPGQVTFAPDAEPVAHNLPFDAGAVDDWTPNWHDSKMLAHLSGERDTVMKSLSLRLLGKPMVKFEDVVKGTPEFYQYCVNDSQSHLEIYQELRRRASVGTLWLYDNVEQPMLRIYARWSMQGVFTLDRKRAAALAEKWDSELEAEGDALKRFLGVDSLQSNPQLQKVTGLKSVAEAERMKYLDNPKVAALHQYRTGSRAKYLSTYLLPWLKWPWPRIGTLWRPTGAWTGRPSSKTLNLQNIPTDLADLLGEEEGYVLLAPDYAQLEARIIAHLSQDANLLDVFSRGVDVLEWVQGLIGMPGPEYRRWAKVLFYGTVYGGEEQGLSMQAARFGLAPTRKLVQQLKELQATVKAALPGVLEWCNRVQDLDQVPGLFGRTHHVPPHPDQGHRRREARAAPPQGGGSDATKLATIALEKAGFNTRHQIHDSVLIKLPVAEDTPDTRHAIAEVMEGVAALSVPLKVDVKLWGEG
jgi:uracil-DNA glycosylase family 4